MKDTLGPEHAKFDQFCSVFNPDKQSERVSVIQKLCDEIEDVQFSYYSFTPWAGTPKDALIKTTYDETWQNIYFEKQYYRIDPVVKDGIWRCSPFSWSDLAIGSKEVRNFFSEAEEFRVGRNGFSVTACCAKNRRGVFSVNSRMKPREWELLLRDHAQNIVFYGLSYHEEVCSRHAEEFPTLSNRESQVLYWSAQGKTVWEIGCILDLAPATVGFYMRRICAKLNAVNKSHAVALAIGQGLINPFEVDAPTNSD